MARKHQHEDHLNHEAWAIPYGDLVTLLLAFFVVMYSISSVNEGKYRAVSDSLSAAFGGAPRTIRPLQIGQNQLRGAQFDHPAMVAAGSKRGPAAPAPVELAIPLHRRDAMPKPGGGGPGERMQPGIGKGIGSGPAQELHELGGRIEIALSDLVKRGLVRVRRGRGYLEVEIQSDLLFQSGVAVPTPAALATVRQLADVLRQVPNAVRVEGYTDDQPISTLLFRSNWDLSTARATSVVHELINAGIAPPRLAAMGYGEYQPVADNATVAGRNANRRVELVILAASQGVDAVGGSDTPPGEPAAESSPAQPLQAAAEPRQRLDSGTGGGFPLANGAP